MLLPKVDWQEDSLELGTQDLPPGSDTQATTRSMPEDPESAQVIEARSDTPSPYTREGYHHLGQNHQMRHSNSA